MLPEGFEFRSHSAQGHGVLRSDALSDVRELSHGFGPLVRLGLYRPGRHPDRPLALHHQVPLPRHERLGRRPRGGYFATASCSHFMPSELFEKMLRSAALDAGVELRQIEARQQSPDHPILWNVPETDYLKFYLFQVV